MSNFDFILLFFIEESQSIFPKLAIMNVQEKELMFSLAEL